MSASPADQRQEGQRQQPAYLRGHWTIEQPEGSGISHFRKTAAGPGLRGVPPWVVRRGAARQVRARCPSHGSPANRRWVPAAARRYGPRPAPAHGLLPWSRHRGAGRRASGPPPAARPAKCRTGSARRRLIAASRFPSRSREGRNRKKTGATRKACIILMLNPIPTRAALAASQRSFPVSAALLANRAASQQYEQQLAVRACCCGGLPR